MRAPDRIQRFLGISFCVSALLSPCGRCPAGQELALPDELTLPSLWVRSLDPRVSLGYKDNVLLSNQNTVDSPFAAAGLDLTLYRLPVNGWEYLFFSSADYIRYLNARQVHEEATAIIEAQIKKALQGGWKAAVAVDYIYFNQVFDASTFEDELRAIKVEAHGITLRPTIIKDLGANSRLELELPTTRQFFREFIDDYWEVGPKLTFARDIGPKSDVAFSYQFTDRIHDTRLARDSEGRLQTGKRLRFYQHEIAGVWRQGWDDQRRWRTTTKLSLRRNQDSGGGYYDYFRPQLSEQVRFRAETWEIRAEARFSYYHYDHERIGPRRSPLREKTYVSVNLRGEKALTKSAKLFAQYEHEHAFSNLEVDTYAVNTISAGLEWMF